MEIPKLKISFGQLAWAINFGQDVPQHKLDKLNYLRQLGIPEKATKKQQGSGNRLTYGYEDLVECGVALYALNQGMKPSDITKVLLKKRGHMKKIYRNALINHPENSLNETWVRSRGQELTMNTHDLALRLHDKYDDKSGEIDVVTMDEFAQGGVLTPLDLVERFPDGSFRALVPLSLLAMQWTYWAVHAPEIRPGPKG